ncbi:MAG: beta-galactosidase [Erythrobacter sp.]
MKKLICGNLRPTTLYCSAATRPQIFRALGRAVASALLALCPVAASAQVVPDVPQPSLGVAWYPEQWPEERWEVDLKMMRAAGMDWVRIAEFSWSTIEPREAEYHLDWLERAVRAAERHGLKVVIGTPTAAPPAWLTAKYPDVLRVDRDGQVAEHGYRAHFNWSSPRYRQLGAKVVSRMAERFGRDPNVVAWQIDNEYDQESFGSADRARFQRWLAERYGEPATINRLWTTAYWSQTYDDWSQVPIPAASGANPGLALAWRHFVTEGWRDYQAAQVDVLRSHLEPRQKITTNLLGLREAFDMRTVTADLDFASWDYYVGSGRFNPGSNGFYHDLIRGLKRRNFWVMETQPGQVNWSRFNRTPERGELRAMAWSAVGHGADSIGYWQWRSALNGQEQYHGVLVGSDGEPHPVLTEVAEIGTEFDRAEDVLAGTAVRADVALLHDFPSRWAWNNQRHHAEFDPVAVMIGYHEAARRLVRVVDVVAPIEPLEGYHVVFAPALHLVTQEAADNLTRYVESGGTLVLGPRSGMKDAENALSPLGQPGALLDLVGAKVRSFHALDEPVPITGVLSGNAVLWADLLAPTEPDVHVLARYGAAGGWVDGQPAIVSRRVGAGSVIYVGADLDDLATSALVTRTLANSGVPAVLPNAPENVEVLLREGAGKRTLIIVERGEGPADIALPAPMHDVLANRTVRQVTLPRYGVAVLTER